MEDEVAEAEGDEGEDEEGEDFVEIGEAPDIDEADAHEGDKEDGEAAPLETAFRDQEAVEIEEDRIEGPAHGEPGEAVADVDAVGNEEESGSGGEEDERPAFDGGDKRGDGATEEGGLSEEGEEGEGVNKSGKGPGVVLKLFEEDIEASEGEDETATEAKGAGPADIPDEQSGAEEEEGGDLIGRRDVDIDPANDHGEGDELVEVGEGAEVEAGVPGDMRREAEPLVDGVRGGKDDDERKGGGLPRERGPGAEQFEKVIDGDGEEELTDDGDGPDAGEGTPDEEGDGEKAGGDHPALGIDVGADGLVGESGEGEGVNEIEDDDPGAGTGDALTGPPGEHEEGDGGDVGGSPPGEVFAGIGGEKDKGLGGKEEDLGEGRELVDRDEVDEEGEDERGEGETGREGVFA